MVHGGTVGWLIDSVVIHNSKSAKPSVPVIVTPAAAGIGISASPRITWNSSIGAYSYQLQLSLDSLFKSFVINTGFIPDTSYQVASSLMNDTVYYLRIRSANATDSSSYSPAANFRIALPTPVTVGPVNGAAGISRTPQVSWSPVPKASSYIFQVSLQQSFGSVIKTDTIKNVALNQAGNVQFTVDTTLNSDTTQYWKIAAKSQNNISAYSDAGSFRTRMAAPNVNVDSSSLTLKKIFLSWGTIPTQ